MEFLCFQMGKVNNQEIFQFFSRLTSNTSIVTSTTNFKTLVGVHPQFSSFPVLRSWVISGEGTATPGSGGATQSKGVIETMTAISGQALVSIVWEKLCSISKVLEGKTRELCICTRLKLEKLPYGCVKPAAHSYSLGSILLT